ncbi:MAG TPA: hypothetical protein VGC70_02435, partial [Burkholderiales bacterium]
NEIFHIWFHPHNLGNDISRRLARVEQVATLIAERQGARQLQSCSMEDLIPAIRLKSRSTAHASIAASAM